MGAGRAGGHGGWIVSALRGVSALIPLPGEPRGTWTYEKLALRALSLENLLRRAALFIEANDTRTASGRGPEKLLAEIDAALKGE